MNIKFSMAVLCASFAAIMPAAAYQGLKADYATCMGGQGKVANGQVVRACTRLINNAAKENGLVGIFYALRATANTDKRSNCRDARKAQALVKSAKLKQAARDLEKINCAAARAPAPAPAPVRTGTARSGTGTGAGAAHSTGPTHRAGAAHRAAAAHSGGSGACGVRLDQYVARLGRTDHFNSRGARLRTVAAILRQDRANYHKFGRRDRGDRGDQYFSSKANRARMEFLLKSGTIGRGARGAIVNGTPTVRVTVCAQPDAIFVEVAN